MTADDVRKRYAAIRRAAVRALEQRDGAFEVGPMETDVMLDALKAIAEGETPRPRLLARAVLDEYRNKMTE